MADDKTAAERAAEAYRLTLDVTVAYDSQVFVAGWEARPVLTDEQIDPIRREVKAMMHHLNGMLDSLDDSVIADDEVREQVYANIRDRFQEANRIENALALLAQGDVPAQTTEALAFRDNPPMPSDEQLRQMFRLNGDVSGLIPALRAVWRNGCDAGMVAP